MDATAIAGFTPCWPGKQCGFPKRWYGASWRRRGWLWSEEGDEDTARIREKASHQPLTCWPGTFMRMRPMSSGSRISRSSPFRPERYTFHLVDCFDGLLPSWTIGTRPDADLVNSMLDQAIDTLKPGEQPLVHSDRGGHYRWPGWITRIEEAGLTRSMSQKGYPPDNAACEGLFGRIKNEMFYNRSWAGVSLEEFMDTLNAYLHWYNEKRIKMSLGALSPLEYRTRLGWAV